MIVSEAGVTITRKLDFDYGHRLINHEGKCRNVHGHRGVIEVKVTAPGLDAIGRVIDFGVLKSVLGGWIDQHWDHGFIYQSGDPIATWLQANDQRCYEMAQPPTAENLAQHFLHVAHVLMAEHGIQVLGVRFWETPNCNAVAKARQAAVLR